MSRRIYRLVLLTLPGWFREEFGREMTQTFAESRGSLLANAPDVIALGVRLHSEALRQDLIYAFRTLRQTPTFTITAIATLAVGLGPTLVVANFLYQIVLAPLPFSESDQLVRMWHARLERNQTRVPLSIPDYMDLRAKQTVFEAFAAHTGTSVAMVIGGTPRQVTGVMTSSGDAPHLIVILTAAIAAVLLIACLNVASLLTVRASMRGSELAVRTALGATGRRLRRQLMVEHMLLACGGGLVAVPLGLALHRAIIEKRLLNLPRTASTIIGWESIAALALLVLAIGAALAWVAIRRSSANSASSTLLGSVRQTGSRGLVRVRQGLVIAEVAATLILLVTAGLMLESARRLAAIDPGFRTENVLTFGVVLPGHAYMEPKSRLSFATRVVDGLKALPGVKNAAMGGYAPMGDMRGTRRFARANRPLPATGQEPVALELPAGADYFSVMGIEVIEGRTFTEHDGPDAPPVMVVSETFARTHFPGESAIGQPIRFYSSRPGGTPPPTREIVGVVRDVRQDGMSVKPTPQMYAPYAQNSWSFLTFFVLTDGDPAPISASVQRVVTAVDPQRPARDVLTTQAIIHGSTERTRAISLMLLTLAGLAILLATVGLYGIVATAAAARSREMAIRAAIGARPSSLLRLVLGQALVAAAAGVAIGLTGSLAITQGLGSLLFEVPAKDPVILIGTGALLLLVSGLAGYLPARRAMVENPAQVLRTE